MKKILVSSSHFLIVDNIDYGLMRPYHWYMDKTGAALTNIKGNKFTAPQLIFNNIPGVLVRYINGNKLDCRRCNLQLLKDTRANRRRLYKINRRHDINRISDELSKQPKERKPRAHKYQLKLRLADSSGTRHTVKEWAELHGIHPNTLYHRLNVAVLSGADTAKILDMVTFFNKKLDNALQC